MNEFIAKWVNPYYAPILHGNYCFLLKHEQQTSFNLSVKKGLEAIDEKIATQLLSGGWREQITGSWFCGLKGWSQFADIIGTKLVASTMTYAGQGHSFALACFANDKSVKYLTEYLDTYLPQTKLVYDQDWVLPALMWVDAQKGTKHATRFTGSRGLWEKYVADKKSDVWQLDYRKEKFWSLMSYCQEHFGRPKAG
jgi:hypothetical protein